MLMPLAVSPQQNVSGTLANNKTSSMTPETTSFETA